MATKSGRTISSNKPFSLKELILRWEALLVLIFLAVNIMNISISPYYLNARNLFTNINNFMDKAMIALPMAFILLLGDIDLSVGQRALDKLGVRCRAVGTNGVGGKRVCQRAVRLFCA